MGRIRIKPHDVYNTVVNDQEVESGALTRKRDNSVFFITSVWGSSIIIKDKDGNTIVTGAGSLSFCFPYLRLDGGFEISGTNLTTVFTEMHFDD